MSSTGAEGSTSTAASSSVGSSSETFETDGSDACTVGASREPVQVDSARVDWRADAIAPAPGGDFYVTWGDRPDDDSDTEVYTARVTASGELGWSARWGNALGWDDLPTDVLPDGGGVLVAGIAATYSTQEYAFNGVSFVRAYGAGGVVRWTWEDEVSGYPIQFGGEAPAVAVSGDDIFVVSGRYEQEQNYGLRIVHLDARDGSVLEVVDSEGGDPRPLAARVADDGTLWTLGFDDAAMSLVHWDGDDVLEEHREGIGRRYGSRARFFDDGALLLLEQGEASELRIHRLSPTLEIEAQTELRFEGRVYAEEVDMVLRCDGSAWVLATPGETGNRLVGLDAALNELWRVPGLRRMALHDDGVILQHGYTPQSREPLYWRMELR